MTEIQTGGIQRFDGGEVLKMKIHLPMRECDVGGKKAAEPPSLMYPLPRMMLPGRIFPLARCSLSRCGTVVGAETVF